MPTQISNQFTEFEFTNAEMFAATRFSELQMMLFQTLLARDARTRVNLHVRPNDLSSLQEEAALKGSISMLEYLIYLATETPNPSAEDSGQPSQLPTQER
jgi:uncharacterized protein YceH (UPF0502 family)